MKLGSANKDLKSFDFSHDVITTSNFGWWQPTLCHEMVQGSSFDLRQQSFVRLSNMVAPTFGNIKLKNTFAFVPFRLVYPNFVQMLQGQQVNGSAGAFIPTEVPKFQLLSIFSSLLFSYNGDFGVYTDDGSMIEEYGVESLAWYYTDNIGDWRFNYNKKINEHKFVFKLDTDGDAYWLSFSSRIEFASIDNVDTAYYIGVTPDESGLHYANLLLKLLNGLGYTLPKNIFGSSVEFIGPDIDPMSIFDGAELEPVSCLPVLAYSRFYYEHLSPQREVVFEDTPTFKFIEIFRDKNGGLISSSNDVNLFRNIIASTAQNYYTLSPDIFTSALNSVNTENFSISVRDADDETTYVRNESSAVPYILSGSKITATAVQGLLKVLKYSNRNTLVGRNVVNWLQSRFGIVSNAEFNNHSYYLGTQNCDISISDIYATANSEGDFGSTLGSYSGRGIGYDNGKHINFKAKEFGYLICLQTVVPVCGYYQGIKPHVVRTKREHFYTTEYENLGYQGLPKMFINSGANNPNGIHGFIPRYADYKFITNTINGDFANGYPAMEAYHLNRTFDKNFILSDGFRKLSEDLVIKGDKGYLRIFANTQQFIDHFLIFNRMNFKVNQPMDTLANSYDVEEHGNGSVDVNYT